MDGRGGVLMEVRINFCRGDGIRGSHGSLGRWLFGGEALVLMAVSHADCGGDAGVLMALSDAGCVEERVGYSAGRYAGCWEGEVICSHGSPRHWLWMEELGFSWRSQTLVVGGRVHGSHGILRRWLWEGRGGSSYGSHRCWLWVGTGGVLKAIPDAACGGRAVASHSSPRCWLLLGDSVVLMAVPDTGCGGRHLFSWQFPGTLCGVGRRGFFWQCHTLVLMGRGGGSHGSPSRWLWGGGDVLVHIAVTEAGCGW